MDVISLLFWYKAAKSWVEADPALLWPDWVTATFPRAAPYAALKVSKNVSSRFFLPSHRISKTFLTPISIPSSPPSSKKGNSRFRHPLHKVHLQPSLTRTNALLKLLHIPLVLLTRLYLLLTLELHQRKERLAFDPANIFVVLLIDTSLRAAVADGCWGRF